MFRGRVVVGPRVHLYAPFYYDPFWGPYGTYYPYVGRGAAEVKVDVTPTHTPVFVDGYYAGVADDFDGMFKRLRTSPGGHVITLCLEGYRTVTQNIDLRPGSTFKLRDTMDTLAAGETSAPVPAPMPRTAPAGNAHDR